MEQREILAYYACRYNGDWNRIAMAEICHEEPLITDIPTPYITICDTAYPVMLKQLRYPPFVLFYEGDITLIQKNCVTVIGSRKITPYGYQVTEHICRELSRKYVLVSGLAKGVDGIVHACAIKNGGRTIGVIGSGLSVHYPYVNEPLYKTMRRDHLILSECPYKTGVRKQHFPWRNRILAALSGKIIVTQAALKSGTMLTVNEALELNREVWCVPHPFDDETGKGCGLLIQQGANLLYETEQLEEF